MPAATDTRKLVAILMVSTSFLLPVSEGSTLIIPDFDSARKGENTPKKLS